MIVSVTTLGSRSGDAAGAAATVVKYLEGQGRAPHGRDPGPSPDLPTVVPGAGLVGYYADSMAAPGIWMGQGLAGVHMVGLADSDQLERVLLGQNPHTGEQLVNACGSAQRAHPDAVRVALAGPDDELLSLAQAAEALGVGSSYLRQQVLATQRVRARQARQAAAGEELSPLPASYLDATQDRRH
ncbi:MAG: relaxase domain-containing protein, partial [Actinomycetota bacterium]|nr:relaxase domain-containing protein [Actinomycetota bacterium]